MRVTAIEVTTDTAVVELRPSWLARLFGARVERIELVKSDESTWRTANTRRPIDHVEHGDRIRHALDFRTVAALPAATLRGGRTFGAR